MTNHLTEKQEAVLQFIEDYQMAHGKSPTLKEMREHFQVSSDNSVLKHVKALEEKAFIKKDDTPRGIGLLESVKEKLSGAAESVKLPVLGAIPAGGPVLSDEYVETWMNVGSDLIGGAAKVPSAVLSKDFDSHVPTGTLRSKSSCRLASDTFSAPPVDHFILRVTGNSMVDAGIFEGDLVVVDSKMTPRDGDVVVALVDNANTLKRFIEKNGKVYLKAENKDYKDIHPEEELMVQGVVKALVRQYG